MTLQINKSKTTILQGLDLKFLESLKKKHVPS